MNEGRHRAADDWRAFLERHPDTRFVDAFMIGLSGQVFGKREAAADLARVYESGVAFSACAAVLDVQGHGCDAQGYGGSDGDRTASAGRCRAPSRRCRGLRPRPRNA